MNGIYVKKQLLLNGYELQDVAKLMQIKTEELESTLNNETIPAEVIEKITKAIGKNIFTGESAPLCLVEGNNNNLGDGNNANNSNIILKLISIIEKKDIEINKLLKSKDIEVDRLLKIIENLPTNTKR